MVNSANLIKFPTGLFTPPIFNLLLDHEIVRAKRYTAPLSLLILSIVKPTPIISNQLFEGIEIKVAQTLNSRLRQSDIPSRNGVDFLILLPNTDAAGSKIVARRLLENLPTTIINNQGDHQEVKFKIGISSHCGGSDITAEALRLQAACNLEEVDDGK